MGAVSPSAPTRARHRFGATIALLVLLSAVEEVVFRGGVLGWGGQVLGTPAALAVSSIGFAASHAFPTRLSLTTWVNLTLYGLFFGLAYLVGGLPASVALHGSWNVWEWGLGFTVSGPTTSHLLPTPPVRRPLRKTPYGPEGHWAATVTCLLAVGTTLVVLRPGGL